MRGALYGEVSSAGSGKCGGGSAAAPHPRSRALSPPGRSGSSPTVSAGSEGGSGAANRGRDGAQV